MKKLLALALVMVLALSLLTACTVNVDQDKGGSGSSTPSGNNNTITPGGNENPSSTPDNSGGGNNNGGNNNQGGDNWHKTTTDAGAPDTVEGILALFNLTLDDVMPDGATDAVVGEDSGEDLNLEVDFWAKGVAMNDFDSDACMEKLYNAIKGISDDGKIYKNPDLYMGNKKEITEPGDGCFYFGGKIYMAMFYIASGNHPDGGESSVRIVLQFTK